MRKFPALYVILIACLLTSGLTRVKAQGMYTDFGQNRVQYKSFEWQYFRTENFDAYFYAGGRELASFAIQSAEQYQKGIEKVLDYRLGSRVELIIYNSQTDYKQSNIGQTEQQINIGGFTQIYDNKIFLYFDGNHEHLVQQIKGGLVECIINDMLYGGSVQERVQNAALLTLPEWFRLGLIHYMAEDWNAYDDSRMKDALGTKAFKRFNNLENEEAAFAGKSIWKYLVSTNDERIISNVMYITRVTRNVESAFFFVLGMRMGELSDAWRAYYEKLYAGDEQYRNMPAEEFVLKKRWRKQLQSQVKISPNGKKMLYCTNDLGRYRVFMYDFEKKKRKKIYKGGYRYKNAAVDKSFPIIGWHPGGEKAGIFYEKKGLVNFTTVDLEKGKKENIKLLKLEKVTGFDYSESGNLLLLSAVRRGQSDLYILDLKTRKERQLTSDFYDDQDARFIDGGSRIIFSSNRETDSLGAAVEPELKPDNDFDIFIYNVEQPSEMLSRLTNTPYVNETQPMEYRNGYYSYLTDYNGVVNRYAARVEPIFDFVELRINSVDTAIRKNDTIFMDTLDSRLAGKSFSVRGKKYNIDSTVAGIDTIYHYRDKVYTYPLSSYSKSIIAHDVNEARKTSVDIIIQNRYPRIYFSPLVNDIPEETKEIRTLYTQGKSKSAHLIKPFKRGPAFVSESLWKRDSLQRLPEMNEPDENVKDTTARERELQEPADTSKYYFINEFSNRENFKIETVLKASNSKVLTPEKKNIRLNTPRMYDLSFVPDYFVTQVDNTVINTYYQPYTAGGENFFNPGFNGMVKVGVVDIFNDKRISGGFRLPVNLRGSDVFVAYENNKKRIDKRIQYYRQSRFVETALNDFERYTVNELRIVYKYPFSERASLRLNVFGRMDRTIYLSSSRPTAEKSTRELNWTGGKLEYVFDNTVSKGLNLYNGLRYKFFVEGWKNVENKNTTLATMGFDIRNYQKLHRQIILATRVSFNKSVGNAKVVYFLGGVDNWLSPRFNNNIEVNQDEGYTYQALATNLRGFTQNIRNGSAFFVINNEIRIPVFPYILNKPLKSDFLKNFLLVPFADVGTAWSGSSPYADDNSFNKRTVIRLPVKATVINIREPLVGGIGAGVRMRLLGYYIRGDMAWGIEDREIKKDPVYYVSLSLDF